MDNSTLRLPKDQYSHFVRRGRRRNTRTNTKQTRPSAYSPQYRHNVKTNT